MAEIGSSPLFRRRSGAEYRLRVGPTGLPLRAGCFFAKTGTYETSDAPWISGLCFGAGFALARFTLDVGAMIHSKTIGPVRPMEGPLRRSSWSLTTSLSYRLGKAD